MHLPILISAADATVAAMLTASLPVQDRESYFALWLKITDDDEDEADLADVAG